MLEGPLGFSIRSRRGGGRVAGVRLGVMVMFAASVAVGCKSELGAGPYAGDGQDATTERSDGDDPGACTQGAAILVCDGPTVMTTCLSDDGIGCRAGTQTNCTNQCTSTQSAFVCGQAGPNPDPDPAPPGDCPFFIHTAAGPTFYCCVPALDGWSPALTPS
jgi:hypothetical protein